MRPDDSKFATVPVGKLGIIVHPSCAELGKRIDQYIVNWRKEREHEHKENVVFKDYEQDTYIIDATCSRFGTGEAKALISDSVRGVDLYILADVLNYSLKYTVCVMKTICLLMIFTQMLSVSSALLPVSQRALLLSCRSFMRAVSIREAPESL